MIQLSEELREYTAMKYAGDCKCGKCQLVPRDLIDRIIPALRSVAPQAVGWTRAEVVKTISDKMPDYYFLSYAQLNDIADAVMGLYAGAPRSAATTIEPVAWDRNALAEVIHRARFKDRTPTPLGSDFTDQEYAHRLAQAVMNAYPATPSTATSDVPDLHVLRSVDDWNEDMGDMLWWRIEADGTAHEAPWVGHPLVIGVTVEAHTTTRIITQINQEHNPEPVIERINVGGWIEDYYTHFSEIPRLSIPRNERGGGAT